MKELISHLLKQVAAILEYVIAFMLAIGIKIGRASCSDRYHTALPSYGMFTSVYSESEHLSELR